MPCPWQPRMPSIGLICTPMRSRAHYSAYAQYGRAPSSGWLAGMGLQETPFLVLGLVTCHAVARSSVLHAETLGFRLRGAARRGEETWGKSGRTMSGTEQRRIPQSSCRTAKHVRRNPTQPLRPRKRLAWEKKRTRPPVIEN
jgi:hypothetical protein